MFADILIGNLQDRFVALIALLVQKEVFTIEEFEEMANQIAEVSKDPKYRERLMEEALKRAKDAR